MTTYLAGLTLPKVIFEQPAASILLPIALGTAVGFSYAPKPKQSNFLALKQPPGAPPPKVFGPVWTTLYGLMGYSAYRAWSTGNRSFNPDIVALTQQGATLYSIQLGLNLIWMPLFYGHQLPIPAAVDCAALTATVGYLIYVWGQVDEVAGWCLAPYLAWTSFATYLTIGVGYLNDWDFSDKQVSASPSTKPTDTTYVNEKSK